MLYHKAGKSTYLLVTLDTFCHIAHEHFSPRSLLLRHPLPLVALEHALPARVKPVTNFRSEHLALLDFADPLDRLGPPFLGARRVLLNLRFGPSFSLGFFGYWLRLGKGNGCKVRRRGLERGWEEGQGARRAGLLDKVRLLAQRVLWRCPSARLRVLGRDEWVCPLWEAARRRSGRDTRRLGKVKLGKVKGRTGGSGRGWLEDRRRRRGSCKLPKPKVLDGSGGHGGREQI